jgi:hypothetical protein
MAPQNETARGIALLALGGLIFWGTPGRAESFEVRVSFTVVHDRVLPTPGTTLTKIDLRARIDSNKQISQTLDRSSGRVFSSDASALSLGGSGAWRVAGPHSLKNTKRFQGYERVILVNVEGSSCSAQITYSLFPGFSDYRYQRLTTGEDAVARSIEVESITCSIQ